MLELPVASWTIVLFINRDQHENDRFGFNITLAYHIPHLMAVCTLSTYIPKVVHFVRKKERRSLSPQSTLSLNCQVSFGKLLSSSSNSILELPMPFDKLKQLWFLLIQTNMSTSALLWLVSSSQLMAVRVLSTYIPKAVHFVRKRSKDCYHHIQLYP